MKYITFILMIVALITFTVSCTKPCREITDETILVLKVVPKDDGQVMMAVSVKYQGEEWLEDIDLKLAEYVRYENLPKLPVKIEFRHRVKRIDIFLNGRRIKMLHLSKTLADELAKKIEAKRKTSIGCNPTEDPTG